MAEMICLYFAIGCAIVFICKVVAKRYFRYDADEKLKSTASSIATAVLTNWLKKK